MAIYSCKQTGFDKLFLGDGSVYEVHNPVERNSQKFFFSETAGQILK